jgi:5-dehydro-4-deoxyglucarate dehydratase
MENVLLARFPGVIGFPVTPFSENEGVDAGAFRENLEFMLNSDLVALTCCGSNGELQALTLDEYRVVAEMAGTTIGGKKGLILGVGQTLRTAQEQARIARKAGADAVIIMAPYTADANEPGIAEYYRRVAGEAELPAFLYQTKWSGVLPLSLLDRLSDVENICMVKDEHGSLSHYLNVRVRFGDRFYWVNGMAEPFVPSYWNLGARTFTSGLACFMPQITGQIFHLAVKGDFTRINELLDEIVVPLYEIRNRKPGYKVSMIKAAMDLAGLKGGKVRPPLIDLSLEDRADLEELMSRTGLLGVGTVVA